MSLRSQACADALTFLGDTNHFGWPIQVRDPSGLAVQLVGYSNDVHETIDPDTGQAVSGRQASVALHIATLKANGLDLPIGIEDGAIKPWVIRFNDILGVAHTFKVMEALPDRAIGIVVCMLETYKV